MEIVWNVINVILTALAGGAVSILIAGLNTKIKDEKLRKWATEITTIVTNVVQRLFQTTVETLKKEGKFTKEAQEEVKAKAKELILGQLTDELKNYIEKNYGDMEAYLENLIESIIYQLKQKAS